MKKIVFLLSCMLSISACATVTRGTTQTFSVETDPIGAQVTTSNGFSCNYTPCSFTMKRKHPFTVTVEKEGYETVTTEIQSNVSGGGGAAMAGNVLVGGLIGAGVDASTGAMNELKPNPLIIKMQPAGTGETTPADQEVSEDAGETETDTPAVGS